jgi:predicted aldo/keto reductase-like oxidoreductase
MGLVGRPLVERYATLAPRTPGYYDQGRSRIVFEREGTMTFESPTTLGTTGISVGRLGVASSYRAPAAAYEEAFDAGCNYFTWGSFIRGRSRAFQEAARSLFARGQRSRVVLGILSYAHSAFLTETFLKGGLKKLGTDYADVLLLGYFSRRPPQRLLDGAVKLKESGMVRAIGITTHNRALVPELAREGVLDLYHVRYNAAHRGGEEDLFPHVMGPSKPGIVAFTATCWGRLLSPKRMPPGEKPATAVECYRFALTQPAVDLCMTGPRTLEEMRENLATLAQGPMTEEELTRMRRIGDHLYRGRR